MKEQELIFIRGTIENIQTYGFWRDHGESEPGIWCVRAISWETYFYSRL